MLVNKLWHYPVAIDLGLGFRFKVQGILGSIVCLIRVMQACEFQLTKVPTQLPGIGARFTYSYKEPRTTMLTTISSKLLYKHRAHSMFHVLYHVVVRSHYNFLCYNLLFLSEVSFAPFVGVHTPGFGSLSHAIQH